MPDSNGLDQTVAAPRGATAREWELFVRESEADPLTHVGSVSGPSSGVAREQAEQLFGWTAETLWLCPADEIERVQSADLTLDPDGATDPDDEHGRDEEGVEP